LGVVEIDERAKMKTKADELDFGLQLVTFGLLKNDDDY
jgi:hypothetical protein